MITKVFKLKKIKQKIPFQLAKNQQGLIMPVGDIHFGSPHVSRERIVEHFKWGMDRGAFFIGMGDYLDFTSESQMKIISALRDSTKRALEDDVVIPAVKELIDLLSFTAGRWIGLVSGNHCYPFMDGTNTDQMLAAGLGTDYLGTMTMVRVQPHESVGSHHEADTIIVAHHGVGGGITIGGQLSKPEHMLKWVDADIILMGHSHAKLGAPIDRIYVTPDGVTAHRTTVIARTGSFLKAYDGMAPVSTSRPAYLSEGSYVEKRALMPSSLGGLCFGVGISKIPESKFYKPEIHFSV